MAPNPIVIPRKPLRQSVYEEKTKKDEPRRKLGLGVPILATSFLVLLFAWLPWVRRWVFAGAGIESLLIVYGHSKQLDILPSVPLWTLLATFNLAYAICSTSWLLHALFVVAIYPFVVLTSVNQFPQAANLARRALRKVLGNQPHFVRDKLALFNLPALEIDTDVDGLFVIRGVSLSFSSLSLVAHGLELGIKLAKDIELAIYVDEVTVRFFRHIEIGDVYANVKGEVEMTFAELEADDDDASSEFSVFLDDTPLLRAATAGSKGMNDRPQLRETLTGVSYMRDSSARAGLDIVQTLSPDDEIADQQYHDKLTEIRTSSAVYQSRQAVRQRLRRENNVKLEDEKEMRAAVSAELHNLPSVPHPPQRSIRVTTLQNLSSPYVRRFLHRLPFLLRLLLAPLSYFHPISISSITGAGSGKWLSTLLQQEIFKHYTENNAQLRKLQRKLSVWLADANFCLQLTDIDGLGQVPLSSIYNIVTYLKFDDVMAFRTVPQSGMINQVVRLGGADATFTIPSYLLPHHEHILPEKPTEEDQHELEIEIDQADGAPKTVQAEKNLEQAKKDETNITMSVHGSLPVSCDQSLLNFIASLVKATKMIELEKEVDDTAQAQSDTPMHPTPSNAETVSITTDDDAKSDGLSLKEVAGFKVFAKNIRNNLIDGTTKATIKEFAKDLHQSAKDGMKKAAVGGLVNDRWIAKMTGKVAAALQKAQGDVGYSGSLPVPLAPYRELWIQEGKASKLLP